MSGATTRRRRRGGASIPDPGGRILEIGLQVFLSPVGGASPHGAPYLRPGALEEVERSFFTFLLCRITRVGSSAVP